MRLFVQAEIPHTSTETIDPYDTDVLKKPTLTTRPKVECPRCSSTLRINYEEPECLQCGFVDYAFTPSLIAPRKKSVLSTGTHYILRYVGDFPSLSNKLTHVRLRRLRNRVIYGVACPFCGQDMEQSSLSGKRREVREERYKCDDGHRVSLMPGKNGSLGWK
jgi:hypothetical protein